MTDPTTREARLAQEIAETLYDYLQTFTETLPWEEQAEVDMLPFIRESIMPLVDAQIAAAVEEINKAKNQAYWERNQLVVALSKLFPSRLGRHEDKAGETWEEDWKWIVFIASPGGQLSWHIHDSELHYFDHLERDSSMHWDGHTTEEKYDRLRSLKAKSKEAADD